MTGKDKLQNAPTQAKQSGGSPAQNNINEPDSKRMKYLQLSEAIVELIGTDAPIEEVLSRSLQALCQKTTYDAAQIYRLAPQGQTLWLYLEEGEGTKPVTSVQDIFSIDEYNIVSHVAQTRQPIYISDVSNSPYSYFGDQTTVQSELCIPLESKPYQETEAILLGVLRIQSELTDNFDDVDTRCLTNVARLLASILNTHLTVARLNNDLQEIKLLYKLHPKNNAPMAKLPTEQVMLTRGYHYTGEGFIETEQLSPLAQEALNNDKAIIEPGREDRPAALAAPIQLNGQTVGVMGLEGISDDVELTADDLNFVKEVSSQVALAIENARLIQQTQEQTEELSLLFAASQQLSETIDPAQIYKILTQQTMIYLQSDLCGVALLEGDSNCFESVAEMYRTPQGEVVERAGDWSVTLDDDQPLQQMVHLPQRIVEAIAANDRALTARHQRYAGQHIQTAAIFPLVVRNQLIGILEVGHRQANRTYSVNELQLTQAIIAQVTVAIENAQQFQKKEEALAETQELYLISRALVETNTLDEIYSVVLEHIKRYNVDRISISLIDPTFSDDLDSIDANAVTIVASWDRESNNILPVGSKISSAMFPLVQTSAKPPFTPLISENLRLESEQDPRMDEAFRRFMYEGLGAVTMFSTPMFLGTKYKGVLSISTRTPHHYSDREKRVYQTLADQAIIAIENRRLVETLRRERDQAALLHQIDQTLSRSTSPMEVKANILSFTNLIGATYGEVFISDRKDYSTFVSNIPERRSLQITSLEAFQTAGLCPELELKALQKQEIIVLPVDEIEAIKDNYPSLASIQTVIAAPFTSRHSGLSGIVQFLFADAATPLSDSIEILSSITSQAAAILDNLRLIEQTRRALSETEILYETTRSFNLAQHPEELLSILADSLLTFDPLLTNEVDNMAIGLLPDPGQLPPIQRLNIVARWNKPNYGVLLSESKITSEYYSFIPDLTNKEAQVIAYSQLDAPTQSKIDQYFGKARTIIAVPLKVGYHWLGTLFLTSHLENATFKSSWLSQITTLAGQAAVVIQNLQLVEETQQTLYYSETLSQLGQELLVADTPAAIYDAALQAVAATEPQRGAAIFRYKFYDTNRFTAHLVAKWDNPGQTWAEDADLDMTFSSDQVGHTLFTLLDAGHTVVAKRVAEDGRFSVELKQMLTKAHIESMVVVPLWYNQQISGFLLAAHAFQTRFSSEITRLYEDITLQMSGALENRRLFEEAEYRATLLQTAADVSKAATRYLDLNTLMTESVNLIRDRFGYSHVSIFLLDEYRQFAVVKASTGEIGQKMLAAEHKLAVGGQSIVGAATGRAQARIALDVKQDTGHYKNPLLPDTRSEMALPFIVQGKVIGALDVQSTEKDAFSEQDITILQSMADQIANAIFAAQSAQETKKTLAHMQKLNEHYLREQWVDFVRERQAVTGYQITDEGITELHDGSAENSLMLDLQEPLLMADWSDEPDGKSTIIPISPSEANQNFLNLNPSSTDAPDFGDLAHLLIPLKLQNDVVIGGLDFEITPNSAILDDDHLKIVEAVTRQAAQAIEAARLFEQTQSAREEAEALYKVGRTLVTAEDEQTMYHAILERTLTTLGLHQGGVLLFSPDQEMGTLVALFENGKPSQAGQSLPIKGNASYEKMIETKQPLAIEDVMTDPLVEIVRDINRQRNVTSLLLVPIIIEDQVIGAIGADSVGKKHIFNDWEINLVRAMADQLSIMLQNHRLLEETHQRAVQLETSSDIGRVATSIFDEDLILEQAVDLIRERFGYYHVQVFLIDEHEQYAVLHKSTGKKGQLLLDRDFKVAIGSQALVGQAAVTRQPVVIRDANPVDFQTPDYHEYLPQSQAELAVPLQIGNELIGILDVHSAESKAFTTDEISVLVTLAAQIAIATKNARAFREQQETAERLQEINKLKNQFLANMSHELRTPLNSIIGFSRVILKGIDGPLTELQKTDLTSIHNSGQHLLSLINNILDLSKIEAGKMDLNFEAVELEPIIKGVMSTAVALVKDKPVTLHQDVADDLPIVWADPTRIRQVILNLISNACKFTDEGSVTLEARHQEGDLLINVRDTGVGIPQDQLQSIFEEFTQVDASTTRKVGGTGLGLSISRHFIEMHHGQIWVESVENKGSTFSFTIPITKTETESDDTEDIASAEIDERVIVAIDDDLTVIQLYERFLEPQGYKVIGITDGENVVERVKAHAPSGILLDVLMPKKDGWSLIRELKDDPETENIPVIICSIVSDKKKGFSLGAADYMTKPINEDDLRKALSHLENQQKSQIKVLVIDDQADDVLLIRRILEAQPNYSIIEANSGQQGLEMVPTENPDLIILDLSMPEIDGFSVVEALKNNDSTRSIPIIIVSGKDLTLQEDKLLTGQVEALLQKGLFNERELLEDVREALSTLQQNDVIKL